MTSRFSSSPNHKASVREDSVHQARAGGATSVQRKRNKMHLMCMCKSCDHVLKSGYSVPIGHATLTRNGSPWHSRPTACRPEKKETSIRILFQLSYTILNIAFLSTQIMLFDFYFLIMLLAYCIWLTRYQLFIGYTDV